MGEILKALLASRIGQIFLAAILIIAAGSIVSVLVLLWRVVGRGSTLDLWGLTISSTTTPTSQEAKTASSPGKTIPSEKIVYVKLLHMRERSASQQPVYRYQFWDGQECDVWDEAVYMFYQSFPEEQQSFRWNIRSGGIAHPNLLHPWMDKIEFPDPGERAYGPLVAPICYVPSHVYIPVSHLFNGQQPGNREILLLAESEVAFARLILDASSVPGIRLTRVRAFRGGRSGERQAIGSSEPRPGVFMCQGTHMKAGDTLRFVYDTEAR